MPVPTLPPPSPSTLLATNVRAVEDRIAAAARRAGREPAAVRLVAVTKSVPAAVTAELVHLGVVDLGENRSDVLAAKAADLRALGLAPRWHFVGHLQRNKAREVAQFATLVHSVDSERLLETLDRLAGEIGRELEVLAQVKLTDEPSKSGLDPRDLAAFLARGRAARHVRVVGLMAMGPLVEDDGDRSDRARAVFRRAASLAREHRESFARAPELSIGMSDDFDIAVEEGATLVRVGSRLYAGLPSGGSSA
ncbi:MAG: YggS family pyridoxal phosphate-dependent enzyme [Planctomycetota bacterium]|nr:YggS family pyridoxal phosphate-dependent enzyme [Planctomycetota bacterium]